MPVITIQSLELTDEQKEELADKFISIFSEITRVPKDRIYMFFDGHSLDNVATNGVLFSNNPPSPHIICKYNQERESEES